MNILRDKHYWLGAVSALIAAPLIALAVIASGMMDMSALPDPGPIDRTIGPWALNASRRHHAADVKNPFAENPKSVDSGLDHYRENCLICHGAPNGLASDVALGLNPPAPNLTSPRTKGLSDGELFWTVKNGIKMTGMPAFAPSHNDEEIWHIVSAMRHLGELTPEQTAKLKDSAGDHHHDGPAPDHAAGDRAAHDDHASASAPAEHHHDH